jgi:acetate kinase
VNVLVFNPGSATLKFGVYHIPDSTMAPTAMNLVTVLERGTVEAASSAEVVERIIRGLLAPRGKNLSARTAIDAVGCRVVHGGPHLVKPTRVDASVLDQLRDVKDLAPLHVPADIAVLERILHCVPKTPLIAVFDTAFHQTMPDVAHTYALPTELCSRYSLRRYGFHGISHRYVSARLIERLGRGPKGTRIITCHLGSGASICAVRDGRSIDTSMGLTPMEGLVMGTRSGDVDPGLVLYLLRAGGMTADQVNTLLNHDSGLLGLSALSSDLRTLEQAAVENNASAELALAVFAYRASKYIGAFAAALEGLDAIAFTGGIGEHSASMRSRICRPLEFLGLRLDQDRNRAASGGAAMRISVDGGGVPIWMIPTDEEREIAVSAYEHLAGF